MKKKANLEPIIYYVFRTIYNVDFKNDFACAVSLVVPAPSCLDEMARLNGPRMHRHVSNTRKTTKAHYLNSHAHPIAAIVSLSLAINNPIICRWYKHTADAQNHKHAALLELDETLPCVGADGGADAYVYGRKVAYLSPEHL